MWFYDLAETHGETTSMSVEMTKCFPPRKGLKISGKDLLISFSWSANMIEEQSKWHQCCWKKQSTTIWRHPRPWILNCNLKCKRNPPRIRCFILDLNARDGYVLALYAAKPHKPHHQLAVSDPFETRY